MKLISNAFSLFIIIAIVVMALYGKPKEHASKEGVVMCWGMVGAVPETTPQTSR